MKKQDARKFGQTARGNLTAEERQTFDKIITEKLFGLNGFLSWQNYFVYLNFKTEVSTVQVIKRLLDLGKNVFVPKIIKGKMYAVKYAPPFVKNFYGIDEPFLSECAGKIDLCIAPLSCVDKSLNRVGYGKGYYDRFFAENDCVKVGICYSCQTVEEIEVENTDIPLDVIVTEK